MSDQRSIEDPTRSRGTSIVRSAQQDLKANFALGVLLLLAVVCLWTGSNFITQSIYEGGFEKPFLITYLNTASFALYLIPVIIRKVAHRETKLEISEADLRRGRFVYSAIYICITLLI